MSAYWSGPNATRDAERPKIEEGTVGELSGEIKSIADGAKWLAGVFKSEAFRQYSPGLDGFAIEQSHKLESNSCLRVISGRVIARIELHRRHWNRLLICHELAHAVLSTHEGIQLPDHGQHWRGVYLRLLIDHVCPTVAGLLHREFERKELIVAEAFRDGPIRPRPIRDTTSKVIERSRRELFELACLNATLLEHDQPFAVIGDVVGHYYHLARRPPWTFEPVLFRKVEDVRAYLVEIGALRLPAHSETL